MRVKMNSRDSKLVNNKDSKARQHMFILSHISYQLLLLYICFSICITGIMTKFPSQGYYHWMTNYWNSTKHRKEHCMLTTIITQRPCMATSDFWWWDILPPSTSLCLQRRNHLLYSTLPKLRQWNFSWNIFHFDLSFLQRFQNFL